MYRDRGDEPRRDPPKYVNSPESPIYVKGDTVFGLFQARHAIREQQTAVVVEGNFDVVSLHARGIRHVVAPLGTAFTLAQAKLVKRYAPTLVTLFDADSAGRQAVLKLRGPAAEGGLAVKVANLPTGKDPDDFVRETGAEALAALLAGARGMLEHLIESTLSGEEVRGGSLRDKQARIAEVMKYLSEERDPNVRAMAKSLADRISAQLIVAGRSPSDLRGLERMIGQSLRAEDAGGQPDAVVQQGPRARSEPRPHEIGLAVLGAILDFPELLDDEEVNLALEALEGEVVMGVAAVRQMWDSKKSLDAAEVLDLMPAAIHTFAEPRLVAPVFTQVDEARTELLENTKKLRRLALQGHRVQALDELAKAEQLGDDQAQDDLLRELARRSKEKLGLSK
jgi:DNA primase